jgi:hypothetical protein
VQQQVQQVQQLQQQAQQLQQRVQQLQQQAQQRVQQLQEQALQPQEPEREQRLRLFYRKRSWKQPTEQPGERSISFNLPFTNNIKTHTRDRSGTC